MATPESAFESLMARAGELPEPTWSSAGDLGRRSLEAMVSKQVGDVREAMSRGHLRVHGAGVEGHAAPLAAIGQVAAHWQRAVSAVGASLEGMRVNRGRLSDAITQRTTLMLATSPAPGSVILNLTPRSDPFAEVAPGGQRSLVEAERPLADRANEALIGLLSEAAEAGPDGAELADHIRELGARVASNVKELARSLNAANFDLDASWREPGRPSASASMSSGIAGWLAQFVDGHALDAHEGELNGVVRTLSDVARWRIDTAEGARFVDVRELGSDEISKPRVGDTVRLLVRIQPTARPDGTSSDAYVAVELLETLTGPA